MADNKGDDKIRICKLCGKPFKLDRHARKYCSPECQEEARLAANRAAYRRWWEKNHPGELQRSYPYEAKCKGCGATFLKRSGTHVYCEACQAKRRRKQQIEEHRRAYASPHVETETEERIRKQREQEQKQKDWEKRYREDHVCKVATRCIYGGNDGCHYLSTTGKLRTAGGQHLVKDGRCDLFKRRKRET